MSMDIKCWKEILEPVNNDKNLDANNLIEKIRKKFESKIKQRGNNWTSLQKDYNKWNNQNNDINLIFEVTGVDKSTAKYTLLHLAAHLCLESVVRSLLKVEKIDVNAKGSKKRTPLHIAAEKGNKNITKALIGAKANVDVKDNDDKKPSDLAMNQDIEKLLIAAVNECSQINSSLSDSGFSDHSCTSSLGDVSTTSNKDQNDEGPFVESAKNPSMFSSDSDIGPELLQTENNNTSLNSVTNEQQNKPYRIMGDSLLHFCARYGLKESLKQRLLKTKGFDVNQRDKNGRTPLHIAYQCNQPEIVSLLREYGASVDVKDNDDNIPLDLLIHNLLKSDNAQDLLWDYSEIEQGCLDLDKGEQVCTTVSYGTQSENDKVDIILCNQISLKELYTIVSTKENLDNSGYERDTSSVTSEVDSNSGDRDNVSDDEGDSAIFTTDSLCDIEEQSDEEDEELPFDTPPSGSSTENSAGAVELPAANSPMFVKEQPNTKEQDSQFQNNTTADQLVTVTVAGNVDSDSGDGNLSDKEEKKVYDTPSEVGSNSGDSAAFTGFICTEKQSDIGEKNLLPFCTPPLGSSTKNSATAAKSPSGDSPMSVENQPKLAIKKAIFAICSTIVLSGAAAYAHFVTGIVAVNLVSILSAVVIVATATLVAGCITYKMSNPPNTKMKDIKDIDEPNSICHLTT